MRSALMRLPRQIFQVFLAMTVFVILAVLPAQTVWLDSNFTKRIKVTIDADKVNGDLANFPVFVDLNGMPASFFTTIKDNGADLRVTKTDGSSEVPFELVYLDTNNGAGELHFQANGTLSGTSNSDWYLYYGYNGASAYARDDTYGSENVWTQGYVAVYHLNEDGNTTAGGYVDSTSYSNDGTGVSMTSASDVTGKLGKAQDFDGASDYILLTSYSGFTQDEMTMSLWGNFDLITGYLFDLQTPRTVSHFYGDEIRWHTTGSAIDSSSANLQISNWYLMSFTCSNSNNSKQFYVNNTLESNTLGTSCSSTSPAGNFAIGARYSSASPINGLIDEARISNIARSAEWIWTEYQNQNSPDTFYAISSVENGVPVANGLVAWWDASDLSTLVTDANGQVSEWIDKSGNGNNGTQADPMYQPYTGITTINNLNVLSSNDAVMYFSLDQAILGAKSAFFVLYHRGTNSQAGYVNSVRNYGSAYIAQSYTDSHILSGNNRLNSQLLDNLTTTLRPEDETFLISHVVNSGDFEPAYIGRGLDASRQWKGEIAEVLIYDEILSVAEIADVEMYLSNKWGLDTSFTANNFYPFDNGTYLHTEEKLLKIDFSNDVDIQSGNLELYLANGDLVETIDLTSGQVAGNGTSAISITLSSNLDPATSYYVNIDNGAFQDVFGQNYSGISNNTGWNFTTHNHDNFLYNGLLGWWDASNDSGIVTDSNGLVSEWKNFAPSSAHLSQIDPDYRAYRDVQINNLDVLSSNDSVMYYSLDETMLGAKSAFFVLYHRGTDSQAGYINSVRNYNSAYIAQSYTDSDILNGKNRLNSKLLDDLTTTLRPENEAFLISHVVNSNDFQPLDIGRGSDTTRRWKGEIAEVLIYNEALSESDVYSVESYLANKWGFELNYSSLSPADGSSGFLPSRDLTMTFPQAVDILNGNLSIFEANGDLFETIDVNSGQVTGNGTTTITFNPSSDLNPFSEYYVQIQGGAFTDNANGNTAFTGIYNSAEWNFTTGRVFDPSGFSNSKKITILHSQVNGDVNNFPVYIDLGHMPSSFFSVVKADGSDIRVTNSAQDEEMPFELVSIDKSAKTGELWFRADSLSSTSNSDFYLWYGNGDATAYSADHLYGSENVWSQGYVAVYHMNEDPNGDVVDAIKDSTSFDNDGTPFGTMTSDDLVDGQLGKAIDFDGSNDRIVTGISSMPTTKFTTSAWFQIPNYDSDRIIFSQARGGGFSTKYRIFIDTSGNIYYQSQSLFASSLAVSVDELNYVTLVVNGSNASFTLNDTGESTTVTLRPDAPTSSYIGYHWFTNLYALGLIDEVRTSSELRNSAWVKTEYNNQSSAETFYLIDDQVPGTETSKPMFMMGGY